MSNHKSTDGNASNSTIDQTTGGEPINTTRRRVLTALTCVVGAAGAVGVAVPFVGSWSPSAKAKAAGAPVKIDLSKLEPGGLITEEWRGKPVFILRRTEEALEAMELTASKRRLPEATKLRKASNSAPPIAAVLLSADTTALEKASNIKLSLKIYFC